MSEFDFDQIRERQSTNSIKWDRYSGKPVIPMWVADMDFLSPPSVMAALHSRVKHGVFGYSAVSSALIKAVVRHVKTQFDWTLDPHWLVFLPGLVTGLNVACRAVGEPGDAVITATPVYPPFLSAPVNMARKLITAPMIQSACGQWQFDWPALASAVTPETRLFLLCSPHNPTGRLWRREELEQVVSFCQQHNLILCSDEIHADLVLSTQARHMPTASLSEAAAQQSITLMAPSKTFNIAGLGCAFAIVPDAALRARFEMAASGIVPHVNLLGYTAALGAYQGGMPWLKALLSYLRGNHRLLASTVAEMPGLRMSEVEATYLAWIDTRESGIEDPASFFEAAGVGLSCGRDFGAEGFVRLNFGCPRALLEEALQRMHKAMAPGA